MDESLLENQNTKNPVQFFPVIQCVMKFLNVEDIKKFRFVSYEWNSSGRIALMKRAQIRFTKNPNGNPRLPGHFHSIYLNWAPLFKAFHVSGEISKKYGNHSWTVEELTKFFEEHRKQVKELKLNFSFSAERMAKIDVKSWISGSPMVEQDVNFLTKLCIEVSWKTMRVGYVNKLEIPPLHLIKNIKELSLSNCRVNLEPGIRICPVKLNLFKVAFFEEGTKLDEILINEFMDFGKAKEVSLSLYLSIHEPNAVDTKYAVDMSGNCALEKLVLSRVKILNGETSQWVIDHLETSFMPYTLNSQMKIKELSLCWAGIIDLYSLPISVEKLTLHCRNERVITCSQPVVFKNLQDLHIFDFGGLTDLSFPSHFKDCPQLKQLKLEGFREVQVNSLGMPATVKTLVLEDAIMKWVDENYLNLEKLIVFQRYYKNLKVILDANIRVDDFVVYNRDLNTEVDLVDLLEYRKRFNGNHIYIGELEWGAGRFEKSALKGCVNFKSPFYIFENGKKGRALSKKIFLDRTGLSKYVVL